MQRSVHIAVLAVCVAVCGNPAAAEPLEKARYEAALATARGYAADAKDADLEPQCASKQVEQNAALMMGVGVPLIQRPPFKDFPR